MFSAWKQNVNIKYFMVVYVGGLFIFSSFWLSDYERLFRGALIVLLYALFDLLWTYTREKIWYLPLSSLISGFILAVVSMPAPSLLLIVALPLIAVFSKQFLHFGRQRHVFNPAAFAMAVAGLFVPSVSWWGVTWGLVPLIIAILGGIFILWRQNRWHVVAHFLGTYVIFLSALFLSNGTAFHDLLKVLRPQVVDGTLIFFMTAMLIEPVTSMFPTKREQALFGALVGFFAVITAFVGQLYSFESTDPLLWGLLLGNIVAVLLFLPRVRKM